MWIYSQPEYRKSLEMACQSVPDLNKLTQASIMITGARGLIGSFLTDLLLYCTESKGLECQIFATGRDVKKLEERFEGWKKKERLHFLEYELGCANGVGRFPAKVDYIIHCAGSGSPAVFMERPAEFVKNTVVGVYDILDYARTSGSKNSLFISSGEIYGYGNTDVTAYEEGDAGCLNHLLPRSCYPVAKRAAENMWITYGKEKTIRTVIARVSHTYGPTALPEECRIAGLCLDAALHKEAIELKSEGRQRRSWCYVADCASGLITILLNGKAGEAYNVAPDDVFTISEMAETVADIAGKRVVYKLKPTQENQNFNPMDISVLSAEKLKRLGWRSRYRLEEGIKSTLEIMKYSEVLPDE